jgi:ABC-type uncharacterized transport system involved in gliding motility auxiliary subunit
MELKARNVYGLAAIIFGIAAILFGLVYWFINRELNSTVQASFALGLVGIALFGWLEINLLTRALRSRQARYGIETLVLVGAFVMVVVLLNYVFHTDRFKKTWDMTENRQNSLAPETLQVLSELKEPVRAVGFFTASAYNRQSTEDLLKKYRENGDGKFDYQLIDPVTNPVQAEQYGVARDGQLFVERGDLRETVDFASEDSLTNALVRLGNPTKRTIYFLSGHGERSLEDASEGGLSQIKGELEAVNYQLKTLEVLTTTVPADATAIVIAGPTGPYSQQEVDTISGYIAGGGKALFLIEPSVFMGLQPGDKDPLTEYLAKSWGMTLRDDFVIDPGLYVSQFGPTVPVADPSRLDAVNPITKDLNKRVIVFFPSARSIDVLPIPAAPDVTSASLIFSSENAWGETDFNSIQQGAPAIDGNDVSGPLTFAATGENTKTKARVVAIGDSEFAINGFTQNAQSNNGPLFLNALKWAAADDTTISLTPKPNVSHTIPQLTIRDQAIILLLACIVPPLLVVIGAVAMWWSRRRG